MCRICEVIKLTPNSTVMVNLSSSIMVETPPSVSIDGPNNEYTINGSPLNFSDAKTIYQASELELVSIETFLTNVDVNTFCLNFMG